ncbi:MAG: CusA/CzcA family heavy metal efflux RND transporter [Bacteroidota bacterium]
MLDAIIKFSIRNKLLIVLSTLTIAAFGVYSLMHIPVGAVPDITNNQVQVITTSGNLSTQDVEQFITYPVELEMANLPGVKEIRSVSKFGLSVVTIVFEERMGTYLPRQLIAEKIKSASENIPEGFGTPVMGPITTGLGEIYQYILDKKPGYESRYTPMELRTIQDWIVKRQLSGISGVVEINSWGGYARQYEVAVNPERLKALGISLIEVFDAVQKNNSIAGGAYIEKQNQSFFIRGEGLVKNLDDIGAIVVRNKDGIPVLVRDLATVQFGHANRFGAITANGEGEKVLGQIMMLKDANSKQVIDEVKRRVAEIQPTLPEGVYINPILERSELIGKTTTTVAENLILGCLIVIFVVVLLLGNIRSGLVIASLIPLALLFTISMMYIFGIDANLMSLGAIDFGIIIDGAVIIVEFIAIKMNASREDLSLMERGKKQTLIDSLTFDGASRMMSSAIFGQFIILVVFIPILSLTGVEGKMFRPMALAFSFALIGAIIFCFTWLPVAAALFLKPEKEKKRDISAWIMKIAYRSYKPVIEWSYDHKKIILGMAVASLVFTLFLFSRMGGEFVPTLDEGDFVIQPVLKTGTSLSKTVETTTQMEQILKSQFPEIDQIVCRIGAAEVPTDPMSMEEIDMIIKLKPREEWVSAKSKEELADLFKEALLVLPGIDYEFTQPIEMRFNELITGVRADVAVKVFGEDLDILAEKAVEIKKLIENIEGAADIIVEKTAGLPQMSVRYNREKLARYGLNVSDMNEYLTMAFGGKMAGSVFEGEKRFDMVLRLPREFRKDLDNIRNLAVNLDNGNQVPLSELAMIDYSSGPAKISRDNTHRRVVVSINVRNRDMQSVVMDVQKVIGDKLVLPPGYYVEYGGQFENLQNASRRLKIAVPVALLIIFIFLHFAFKSLKEAAMVFSAIPLATVGGVLLLWIRGMPFSISAGVGFIALFGIAVLNGIVLIEYLKELKDHGITDMRERIMTGTRQRLRPVMLTASAAALGFLPMAISTSAGAEVQRPLATVVIGGLVTSTMLTMIALPLLYAIFDSITGIQLWPLKFKRGTGAILLLLLLPAAGLSGQNKVITLDEAISISMVNNREFQQMELSSAESSVLVSSAFSIPKTGVYYSYDQNNIAANDYPIGVFGIEQSFDFPGLYFARRNMLRVEAEMSRLSRDRFELNLRKEVSLAWYRLVYLQNRDRRFAEMDSLYRKLADGAATSFEVGESAYLDLLNARTALGRISLERARNAQEIADAEGRLNSLLQYDTLCTVPDLPLEQVIPVNKDTLSDPGLALAEQTVAGMKSRIAVEKNALLPGINLGYFSGTNTYPGASIYNGYVVGLSLPIFFSEYRSRIRAGKLAYDASLAGRDNYLVKRQERLASLQNELSARLAALEQYRQTESLLAGELLKVARISYEKGDIDFYRYIQSIDQANSIYLNYLDNLAAYNATALELQYFTL